MCRKGPEEEVAEAEWGCSGFVGGRRGGRARRWLPTFTGGTSQVDDHEHLPLWFQINLRAGEQRRQRHYSTTYSHEWSLNHLGPSLSLSKILLLFIYEDSSISAMMMTVIFKMLQSKEHIYFSVFGSNSSAQRRLHLWNMLHTTGWPSLFFFFSHK